MNTSPSSVEAALTLGSHGHIKPFSIYRTFSGFIILMISFIICISLKFRDKNIDIFYKSSFTVFVVWVINDTILTIIDKEWGFIAQIVLQNAIGGIIFGFVFYLSILLSKIISTDDSILVPWKFSATLFLCGFILATAFYVISGLVFRPVPIQVQFLIDEGQQVYFASDMEGDVAEDRAFLGPFPSTPFAKRVTLRGPGATLDWHSINQSRSGANISLSFFGDCAERAVDSLPNGEQTLEFSGVRSISMSTDARWYSRVDVLASEFSTITRDRPLFGIFWLNDTGELHQQANFQSRESRLQVNSPGNVKIAVFVSASEEDDNGDVRKQPFEFKIMIDDSEIVVPVELNNETFDEVALECETTDSESVSVESGATMLLEIRFPEDDLLIPTQNLSQSEFRIEYGDAWVGERDISAFDNAYLGRASLFIINGEIPTIEVNGTPRVMPDGERSLQIIGSLRATAKGLDEMEISGVVDYAWIDSRRLNLSRWESLPDDWKMWIIGGIATALMAMAKFLGGPLLRARTARSFEASL